MFLRVASFLLFMLCNAALPSPSSAMIYLPWKRRPKNTSQSTSKLNMSMCDATVYNHINFLYNSVVFWKLRYRSIKWILSCYDYQALHCHSNSYHTNRYTPQNVLASRSPDDADSDDDDFIPAQPNAVPSNVQGVTFSSLLQGDGSVQTSDEKNMSM